MVLSGDEGSKRLEGVFQDQIELRKMLENLNSSENVASKEIVLIERILIKIL